MKRGHDRDDDGDLQGELGAPDDLGQHVLAEVPGAEGVVPTGREIPAETELLVVVLPHGAAEEGEQHQQDEQRGAEDRGPVTQEAACPPPATVCGRTRSRTGSCPESAGPPLD